MTQTIDTSTVKHVASLVRLGISEEEAQKFSGQFSSIIDYFNMLNEVDTENVIPASDIANAENVLRDDVVKPSMGHGSEKYLPFFFTMFFFILFVFILFQVFLIIFSESL